MRSFLHLRKPALATAVAALLIAGRAHAGKNIVETAVDAGSFQTLAAALDAAGLVDALKGKGPFTVFAPTDDAFAKLPAGTVETLLKPENKDQLVSALTYHVVAGSFPADKVVGLKGAKTLNGQRVDIRVKGSDVYVDGAKVVKTDVPCDNGVIHVIDSVILPAADSLPAVAEKAGTFRTLLAAAEAAGLVGALSGDEALTVFAPTDDAFAKLPKGTIESLLKPENKEKLAAILKYHVVPGRVYSEDAVKLGSAKTLQGGSVSVAVTGGKAKVNSANLLATDIDAKNGVIHVIDSVLMPPDSARGNAAAESRAIIEHAVSSGVKLYNSGHAAQCAGIYAEAAQKLVSQGRDVMPPLVMAHLASALNEAENCHCSNQKAWTLRKALDQVYASMQP